jgi:hypothetical protein
MAIVAHTEALVFAFNKAERASRISVPLGTSEIRPLLEQ